MLEAYHLLAAQGDADVDTVLRHALILIDPMQNPDGRARFVFQNLQGRPPRQTRCPTTRSTTSRGRADGRTITCST